MSGDALLNLETLLPDLPAAIGNRRLGDTLSQAMAKLHNADYQIDRIEALLTLSAELGFGEAKDVLEEVLDAAYVTGEALEGAETAAQLDKALFSYEQTLIPSLNNLNRNLGQHWRTVVARQFEPMIAIGNLLSKIDAGSNLGAELAACGSRARATNDGLGGRALLDHVQTLLAQREQLQQRRREELGDGDIARFINALAEDRATIDLLTPEVMVWLNTHNALDKLKIRPTP